MSKFIELTAEGSGKKFYQSIDNINRVYDYGYSFITINDGLCTCVKETAAEIMAKIREGEGCDVKGELLQTGGVYTVKDLIKDIESNNQNIVGTIRMATAMHRLGEIGKVVTDELEKK